MLILNRRLGESICVGDDIVVTVTGIKGPQVRLGIAAPPHIAIHREEIYRKIAGERAGDSKLQSPVGERRAARSAETIDEPLDRDSD